MKHINAYVAKLMLMVLLLSSVTISANAQQDDPPEIIEPSATLSNDAWDDRFGVPGIYNGKVFASTVSAAGDLYVGGIFTANDSSVGTNQIARWDGRRWSTLGSGLTHTDGIARVRKLATYNNLLYAAGDFNRAGSVVANGIARWNGTQWSALGTGVGPRVVENGSNQPGAIYSVATAPNGHVYVAGRFTHIDGVAANGVARWDGTQWSALGGGLIDRGVLGGGTDVFPAYVYALAVAPNGDLYAGGMFTDAGNVRSRNIARWNGTQWTALGTGVTGSGMFNIGQVEAIAINGNNVYVGGIFNNASGTSVNNLAMWNGSSWSDVGGGVSTPIDDPSPVQALLVLNNALYVGGTFTQAGNKNITALARWDGANWSAVGPTFSASGTVTVYTLSASKTGGVFAGGNIDKASNKDVHGITHWNGTEWQSLGQGVALAGDISGQVNAIAIDALGRVYIGGMINTVGGMPVNNIAMWDGSRWHDVGGGIPGQANGIVYALLAVGTDIYVGGDFQTAGNISASRIAKWNGNTRTWSALGAGIDGTVYALASYKNIIYAGGSFTKAGNQKALDVAAWNGTRWSALGGNMEIFEILDTGNEAGTFVRALEVDQDTGELFIGGHFQTVHDATKSTQDRNSYTVVHNVVSYFPDTQTWFTVGNPSAPGVTTNGFSGISTTVYALRIVNKGLYVGGTFNRASTTQALGLARYDLTNGTWSSPGTLSSTGDVSVRSLAAFGERVVVGGTFTAVNGLAARSVAMYNTVNRTWDLLGNGLAWKNGVPRATAAAIYSNHIWIGGEISKAGPYDSLGVAHYTTNLVPTDLPNKIFMPLSNN